jgi:hypothetical protein
MSETQSEYKTTPETALAPTQKRAIATGNYGLQLATMDEMWRFSGAVVKSGICPKGFTQETVMVAMQCGMELGLKPMQAVQNIAVVNGRPAVFGDMALALVRASDSFEAIEEYYEIGDKRIEDVPEEKASAPDNLKAVCRLKRRGQEWMARKFSVKAAKNAQLWSKSGPWNEYWGRMLQMRARSFAIRDCFADVLKGVGIAEELQDIKVPAQGAVSVSVLPASHAPEIPEVHVEPGNVEDHTEPGEPISPPKPEAQETQETKPPEPEPESSLTSDDMMQIDADIQTCVDGKDAAGLAAIKEMLEKKTGRAANLTAPEIAELMDYLKQSISRLVLKNTPPRKAPATKQGSLI